MGTAFRRRRDGTLTATLHTGEIDLLASLVSQLLELLADGEPTSTTSNDPLEHVLDLAPPDPPSDPVLRRLFPDAYSGDDSAAGDFRRYTERGLRDTKRRSALVVLDGLEQARSDVDGDRCRVSVQGRDADAWMRALTDLRLALGTRLGVEQDVEPDWADDADDPRRYVLGVYEWLGWLQDTLVHAVMR